MNKEDYLIKIMKKKYLAMNKNAQNWEMHRYFFQEKEGINE